MSSLFADIKTPFVNEATLKRIMSSRVKENIFQNIFTRPNEAVTEKFSEDTDAAEIQVIRVKPDGSDAREIGDDLNGNWFNGESASYSTTAAYGIKILTTIDRNIDIPTNQQDMMNVDVAEAELANLAGRVNRNINAMTIAEQLRKNFTDVAAGTVEKNWITVTNDDYLGALIEAGGKLDDGNAAEGVDAYPDGARAVIVRSSVKTALLKKGQVIIGGSDAAQNILRKGGLSENDRPEVASTAYVGEVANMPVYVASQVVWTLAERYLGLTPGRLDGVQMLVVSAVGTLRALAFNSAMKIIDSPDGQGRRLQPKYRMGTSCIDALSVVPVVDSSFVAPSNITIKAPASRVQTANPVIAASGSDATITCATAGATIYYTTDGSTPTEKSSTVTSGGKVSTVTGKTVKAVALVAGGLASAIVSKTF
nr:MAG TPA: hypothetical protein [Caudoviricetes sp.]